MIIAKKIEITKYISKSKPNIFFYSKDNKVIALCMIKGKFEKAPRSKFFIFLFFRIIK